MLAVSTPLFQAIWGSWAPGQATTTCLARLSHEMSGRRVGRLQATRTYDSVHGCSVNSVVSKMGTYISMYM